MVYALEPETKRLVIWLVLIHNVFNAAAFPFSGALSNGLRAAGDVKYTMVVSIDETGIAQTNEHETVYADESETIPEETRKDTAESSPADAESKILDAYFTWAENTVVEDESQIHVDAATSASVLAPGNAARIAGWIQERTGGALFSIVVTEPYSSDYDECLNRAAGNGERLAGWIRFYRDSSGCSTES